MQFLLPYVTRSQHRVPLRRVAVAGLGSALTVAALGLVGQAAGSSLLVAALGASCVLVFVLPESSVSQPFTLVAGHVVSATVGWLVSLVLPLTWWSVALAVGLAISTMAVLRLVHPPAGADPIVLMTSSMDPVHLLAPVLVGSVLVVAIGALAHRSTGTRYPAPVVSFRVEAPARQQEDLHGRSRREPQPAG